MIYRCKFDGFEGSFDDVKKHVDRKHPEAKYSALIYF